MSKSETRVSAARVAEMLRHRQFLASMWETLNREVERLSKEISAIDRNIEAEKRSVKASK